MKSPSSVRVWTWCGVGALALTVGIMTRRAPGGAKSDVPEELRDAVASPALSPAARVLPPGGAFSRLSSDPKRAEMSARLRRLADELDAKAASLRRSARTR